MERGKASLNSDACLELKMLSQIHGLKIIEAEKDVCGYTCTYLRFFFFFQLCMLRVYRNRDFLLAVRIPRARSWFLNTLLY